MKDKSIRHNTWHVGRELLSPESSRFDPTPLDIFMDGVLMRTKIHMSQGYPSRGTLPYFHIIDIIRADGSNEKWRSSSSQPMQIEDWGFIADNFEQVERPQI